MKNLREARLKAGLTQMELARKVGVSITTIRGWEYGGWNPDQQNKEKLYKILEIKKGE